MNTKLDDTLKERSSRYGDFSDNADVSQKLKEIFALHLPATVPNYVQEALDLIAMKLSRIVTGDPLYVDNWHDIGGYCKLVEERATAARDLTGIADDFALIIWHPSHNVGIVGGLISRTGPFATGRGPHSKCLACGVTEDDAGAKEPCTKKGDER